ncbi:class I SAM-dependent methyltransferase [Haloarchaeobius litoreus]|uniref:Class I SAM-dependent methyltransferase n=1 Tax=Haloarchaeobius litoreus TaxID=755306 RepID=A0ABD6DIU4_9EURY
MQRDDDEDARASRAVVRQGYDELADTYASERGDQGNETLLDRLRADAPPGPFLDAGCGDGRGVLDVLASERSVAGLDLSQEQARRANDVAPGRVVQGDMTALPYDADTFAGVTAFYSIIHVPAAETPDVYEEFARVLRPGGVALVTTGTEDWTGRNDDWLAGGAPMEWEILGREASTRHLEAADFEVFDAVGVIDTLGDDRERGESQLVDAESDDAEKLFLFARLDR